MFFTAYLVHFNKNRTSWITKWFKAARIRMKSWYFLTSHIVKTDLGFSGWGGGGFSNVFKNFVDLFFRPSKFFFELSHCTYKTVFWSNFLRCRQIFQKNRPKGVRTTEERECVPLNLHPPPLNPPLHDRKKLKKTEKTAWNKTAKMAKVNTLHPGSFNWCL